MTLIIRQIALNGFRKFRSPFALDGLSEGLNIVIEPNETGKSTLLGALRAAFFIRHGTHNRLAQSFAPYGEAVGPEVQVSFDVAGTPWAITKRFLRNPIFELTGPHGRSQGDEAEAHLNALLGSVRDNSRDWEPSAYGALGLLWVAQAEALSVSGPGQIVRDTIASTLEAEVGSIMGGDAYRRVRERVDAQYELYWSPSGQKKGRQKEALDRVAVAEMAAHHSRDRLTSLERSFTDLESTRARLKIVEREIADQTDNQTRKELIETLDVARAAAQILATRHAENEAAVSKLNGLNDLKSRHAEAVSARERAVAALAATKDARTAIAGELTSAGAKVAVTRAELAAAREDKNRARAAVTSGESAVHQHSRQAAVGAARHRLGELLAIEIQFSEADSLSQTAIDADSMAELEANEREVARAQAVVAVGAIRLILSGSATGITIDGEPMAAGERALTHETQIVFGDATLIVRPPQTAASAEEALASAVAKRVALFNEHAIKDLAAARARNEAARDATARLLTLGARIEALTPADAILGIAAGPEALKLFVAQCGEEVPSDANQRPNIAALKVALEKAETRLARAEGEQEAAITALQRAEQQDAPLALAEAGAESDLKSALALLKSIELRDDWASSDASLTQAREAAAAAAVALETAKQNALAHDVAAVGRKIEVIDARARTAATTKTKLETEVARLEATIEIEGGLGLADRTAAAEDELAAAQTALQHITDEADTLKLLRETLDAARNETSAKFVGPVAKRAKRYIERLLPDCELTFSEDFTLESIVRAGVSEACGDLSQGTREQLAVLTRIAFADMLIEQGKPVSLILDDPLVYSDDGRLDTMIEILTEAATRMQVILLTCRDRAFRHVPANRITL